MPKLFWKHECYQCECPLDVHYHFESYREFKQLIKYKYMFPLYLKLNRTMYKFYGLRVRRVCKWCFQDKVTYNPRKDALRQIGVIRNICPRSKSKTKEEIGAWFYMFQRFMEKNRLSECLVI
ncbi:hypothetical protein [Dishui Lake phycodnavirus 3]|nr:hypothetical protein [Dishui Lake phycodnavirus 3]